MEFTVVSVQDEANHRDWQKQQNYSWEEVNKAIQAATSAVAMVADHQKLNLANEFDSQLQNIIRHCTGLQSDAPEHAAILRGIIISIQIERQRLAVIKENLSRALAR